MSATTAALRDSQLAGALQGAGLDVIADSSAELAQHLKRETQRYGEAIRVSGGNWTDSHWSLVRATSQRSCCPHSLTTCAFAGKLAVGALRPLAPVLPDFRGQLIWRPQYE